MLNSKTNGYCQKRQVHTWFHPMAYKQPVLVAYAETGKCIYELLMSEVKWNRDYCTLILLVFVMVAEMAPPDDLVAEWNIALGDGKHLVQFCHGTLSGKRVILVDGKVNSYFLKSQLTFYCV